MEAYIDFEDIADNRYGLDLPLNILSFRLDWSMGSGFGRSLGFSLDGGFNLSMSVRLDRSLNLVVVLDWMIGLVLLWLF